MHANLCNKIEYRQQAATVALEEQHPVPDADAAGRPAYMSLAAQYGIVDKMDIGDSAPTSGLQLQLRLWPDSVTTLQ